LEDTPTHASCFPSLLGSFHFPSLPNWGRKKSQPNGGIECTNTPYFCDPKQLPGPLPSREEIEASDQFLPSIHEREYETIVVVRDKFVIKHGR
jgi:hypothetical protein